MGYHSRQERPEVIVMSGILMSFGILSFGFSVNIHMAILTRCLLGSFGGKTLYACMC